MQITLEKTLKCMPSFLRVRELSRYLRKANKRAEGRGVEGERNSKYKEERKPLYIGRLAINLASFCIVRLLRLLFFSLKAPLTTSIPEDEAVASL